MSLASPLKLMLMASMMALFISYGYAMEENLSDDEFPYGSPIGSPPEFETCMGDEIMEEDAFAETTRVPFRAVEDDTLIIMERDKEEERKKEILRILKPFHIERMDSLKRGLIKAAAKKIANNETLEKLSSHVKKIQNILSFAFLESKNKNEDFIYDFHCSDIIEDALNLDTNELSSRMQALKQYEVTFTEDMTVQEKVDILKAVFRRRSVNEISSRLKTLKEHAGIFTKDMSQGDKSHVISAILRFDNGDDLPAR